MVAKGIDHAALGRCTQWPESDHLLEVLPPDSTLLHLRRLRGPALRVRRPWTTRSTRSCSRPSPTPVLLGLESP